MSEGDDTVIVQGSVPIALGRGEGSDDADIDDFAVTEVVGHTIASGAAATPVRASTGDTDSLDQAASQVLDARAQAIARGPAPQPVAASEVAAFESATLLEAMVETSDPIATASAPDSRSVWYSTCAHTEDDNVGTRFAGTAPATGESPLTPITAPPQPCLAVFRSAAFHEEDWSARAMSSRGSVSGLYEYDVEIEMRFQGALDGTWTSKLLNAPAFVAFGDEDLHRTHGVITEVELLTDNADETVVFRVRMVPRLWLLTQTTQSRVYADQTVPEIVSSVLLRAGMNIHGVNLFEFRLLSSERRFPAREYVVQYDETDYQFICRLLEHDGIFFFFEQGEDFEKVVFVDEVATLLRDGIPGGAVYRTVQGVVIEAETVSSLRRIEHRVPRRVVTNDYNWLTPDVSLVAESEITHDGFGTVVRHAEHYMTGTEGSAIARVRSSEIAATQTIYRGKSTIQGLAPGVRFTLQDHFEPSFNRSYFVLEVRHDVPNPSTSTSTSTPGYQNEFVAVSSDQPYAPPRVTPRPRIHGLVHGHIYGEPDHEEAPVDSKGRYRVMLPWANAESSDEGVSCWIRRAQPSAGAGYGMHLLLYPGTEVLIAHIDGDPDRPIIVGAVHNEATRSPVTNADNPDASVIFTRGGIEIEMYDPPSDG